MTSAERLLDEAASDPSGTLARGREYLEDLDPGAHRDRAITLRAMSLSARFTNQIDQSIGLAERAAAAARSGGHDDLTGLALLTLSGSLAISGQTEQALSVIEAAEDETDDDEMLARLSFQKGAVLTNVGRVDESLGTFRAVLPVFRKLGDTRSLVLVLNRLGSNLVTVGGLEEAESYLREALDLAMETDDQASIPGIEHNLGVLAAHRGDLPGALELLLSSDQRSMALAGAPAPQHVARCEVLLSAGRFEEALRLAKEIADYNEANHDVEHAANALLVAAHAALLAGRSKEAIDLSTRAGSMLISASAPSLALEAERVSLEARFREMGPNPDLLADASQIASALDADGLRVAAGHARLLAGRMAVELGRTEEAREMLVPVSAVASGPVEMRLQARLASAILRLQDGDHRGAAAAVRSGLDLLDRYQQALVATDLRMGIERHGTELGDIGLRLAVESGRPRRILEWMERTRARALRFAPVTPSADDRIREMLANLRGIDAELRKADDRRPELLRKRRHIQEEIASSERTRSATLANRDSPSTAQLIAALGNATLVELGVDGEALLAVVVSSGRARLIHIGPIGDALREMRQVRFGMRRAARVGRPFDLGLLEALERVTLGSIRVPDGDAVVVPPPELISLPWAGLPSLRGRNVVVAPSADLWWRSHLRDAARGKTVVAAGPDLLQAPSEVRAVAGLYERAEVFPADATVEEVRAGIDGASVAHIACHATFQVENPMFSSLRLGDGELNVYDIERLEKPPNVVVLSACDSGYSETRSGDELAGLTSALLGIGTRTVVASVGLVPDSPATSGLMLDFHRGLIDGFDPAVALARAQDEAFTDPAAVVAAASFICVGA